MPIFRNKSPSLGRSPMKEIEKEFYSYGMKTNGNFILEAKSSEKVSMERTTKETHLSLTCDLNEAISGELLNTAKYSFIPHPQTPKIL